MSFLPQLLIILIFLCLKERRQERFCGLCHFQRSYSKLFEFLKQTLLFTLTNRSLQQSGLIIDRPMKSVCWSDFETGHVCSPSSSFQAQVQIQVEYIVQTISFQTKMGEWTLNKNFSTSCKSWYKNRDGKNFVLWPSNLLQYWWMTFSPNLLENYKLDFFKEYFSTQDQR